MKEEIATRTKLPETGKKVDILEPKGIHLINASISSNGNKELMSYYLLCELFLIEGKKISFEELSDMALYDVIHLFDIVSCILSKQKFNHLL